VQQRRDVLPRAMVRCFAKGYGEMFFQGLWCDVLPKAMLRCFAKNYGEMELAKETPPLCIIE
jgi:hypothetical protein